MKNLKIIIIAAIVLLAGVGVKMLIDNIQAQQAEEDSFYISKTGNISKIIISNGAGEKVVLLKEDDFWSVNNQYIARQAKINHVLKVINRQRKRYPVAKNAHDNVIKGIIKNHDKVEVYETGQEEPTKVFWVGGPAKDNVGSFMVLEKNGKMDQTPYVVYMPGHDGYLTNVYISQELEWRTLEVFGSDPKNITEVSVTYPRNPENNYVFTKNESGYSVQNPFLNQTLIPEKIQGDFFVKAIESIGIESYQNELDKKDSILSTDPLMIVTIQGDEQMKATLYPTPITRRTKKLKDRQGNDMKYDIDRYWAKVEHHGRTDFCTVQYYVWGKVLRNFNDFKPRN